jgi:adenylate cyclase
MVFAYLNLLAPSEGCEGCGPGWGVEAALVAAYFLVAVIVTLQFARFAYRGLGWLGGTREPTDRERRATLRFPGRVAWAVAGAWLVAAGVFTTIGALEGASARALLRTATTVSLVGLLTGTLVLFSLERIGRPVFARALEGDAAPPSRWLGLQPRLVLGWVVSSGVPLSILLLLPLTTDDADRVDLAVAVSALSVLSLLGGFAITMVAARGIAGPLRDVRRALAAVGAGDLEVAVSVDASGEIGQVQQGVNGMVAGLRERQRLETLLGHHVGADVAQLAMAGGDLDSEQLDASALFIDVIGSSAMAEQLAPGQVVERLNELFDAVVRVVETAGGSVNKFDGDGALCVFGAPARREDHATLALGAARELRLEVDRLGRRYPGFDTGIGVSSGHVVAGRVGAAERYEYTVLGGPVNAAARLTELAKSRPTRVLASGEAVAAADPDEARCWRDAGVESLRGLGSPISVFEPGG